MAYIAYGCFLAPRGVKGELFVRLYDKKKSLPKEGEEIFCLNMNAYESVRVERSFSYEKGSVLKLEPVKDKNEAEAFKGKEFFVEGEAEETEGVFMSNEVEGFDVIDKARGKIGVVKGFFELPSYTLLLGEGNRGSFEVPVVKGLSFEVNRKDKAICVDLPSKYPGVDDED
jgi:ribosomal 30S subunit maturation factor RimM